MKVKQINAQLSNYGTAQMYLRQMLTLAENVFNFKNVSEFIDISYVNKTLLRDGSIAWFYDDILDSILALPYVNLGTLDIYGRPRTIEVFARNGSYRRKLKSNEFVIMYDNNGRYPLLLDIIQYSERMALYTRTSDINIKQQRTPRIWYTNSDNVLSLKKAIQQIDSFEDTVQSYENFKIDELNAVLAPAPFVCDKVNLEKERIWSEFLRLIGISNLSYQKKERNITDEIQAMQGGTIASRFSRYQPRLEAIKKINTMFADKLDEEIEVEYYDGLPKSLEENEMEVDIDDIE